MKLNDLKTVQKLKNDLEYLGSIREALKGPKPQLVVSKMFIRPDLAETVFPSIRKAIDGEEAEIKTKLADLGVQA